MKQLFTHQEQDLRILEKNKRWCLFNEPGTGKTLTALRAVRGRKCLVVCPAALRLMWEREAAEEGADIRAVSWNFIQKSENVGKLRAEGYEVIVLDELHAAKNVTSKTCRGLVELLRGFDGQVIGLTGTPATNSGLDYLPYFWMFGGKWMKLKEFGDEYCTREWNRWARRFTYGGVRPDKIGVLRDELARFSSRRTKDECLDLPDKVYSYVPVKLPADVIAEFADISEETVRACIGSGLGLPLHIMRAMQAVGVAKVNAMVELRETIDGPCVLMVTHKEVVQRLKEKLDCVTVTGEDSAAAKDRAVQEFQSGRVQTIVCNTAAGGVGLTLTAASTMIVGEIPWSPAVLRQAEDRIHRIGARRSCQYLYVVGNNSLDNSILATIRSKESYLRPVLGDAA